MRVLRVIGAVFVVSLALAATAVPSVSASEFFAAEYTAELSGKQEGAHSLTLDGLTIECSSATLSGEMTEAVEELELSPSYSGCSAGGEPATIATEGCKYRFDANASDLDIVCSAEKTIKVTAEEGACEAKIGSQNGKTTLALSNNAGPPETIAVNASVSGIKYNKTKDVESCPFSGTGEKENGSLSGKTSLGAFKEEFPNPLIVEALVVTKLCKEAKVEPCKAVYPTNTVLEGTGIANALFEYRIGGFPKKAECLTSGFKTTTSAEEGTPFLPASTSILSLGLPNVCFGCTIAFENLPYKSHVIASTKNPGTGGVEMTQKIPTPPKVKIANCNGETCVYEAGAMVGELKGGEPAQLIFTKVKFGGLNKALSGANCEAPMEFSNTYQLGEPKTGGVAKVWVSNG